ncbi:MAG: hypothetical protein JOZ80_16350, partial [Acidobacteriaceae bacterium]|nr:hypothetical protein [Acidobacteriaceae bacterium]
MSRVRTAKTVAKRIDLQYFARPYPWRKWKFWLSVSVPAIALVWIAGATLSGQNKVYSSGPVSEAHAVFGDRCALCHVSKAGFSAPVADSTCIGCHAAPAHNPQQTFVPACASCHVEHRGAVRLAAVADTGCAQCHGDLKAKDGVVHLNPHVSGFDSHHPEFAAIRAGRDPGTINLNHYVHLQPTLRGPAGTVQMKCEDCHRLLNVEERWPYSVATIQPASQQPVEVGAAANQERKRRSIEAGPGAYMTAIKYVNQCAACHVLQFDPLIAVPAPHDKPEVVHAFIIEKLKQYVTEHPSVLRNDPSSALSYEDQGPRNFLRPLGETTDQRNILRANTRTQSPAEWVQERTAAAEKLLWSKNCRICHESTEGGGDKLPTSVTAIIPSRWFPHAEFDHEKHRMMSCVACHNRI